MTNAQYIPLTDEELEGLFDIGHHTKHVDTIFQRVFGRV